MIILASKSPRRRELMRLLGVEFTVMSEDINETMDPEKPLQEEVRRVSSEKAQAVLAQVAPSDIVVAADTIVVLGSRVMGKPHSESEAVQMLQSLSGKTHQVMTGLTVRSGARSESLTVTTEITFRALSRQEIAAYVASGDPMDKAGAYGIQGAAALFVSYLSGDYYNVMGLPVCALTMLLRQFGVAVLNEPEG